MFMSGFSQKNQPSWLETHNTAEGQCIILSTNEARAEVRAREMFVLKGALKDFL